MIKLLIFDLDGTLIDSAPDIIVTTNSLMINRGLPPLPESQITAAIGEGLKQLVFSLFPETHEDPIARAEVEAEFYRLYEENLIRRTKIYPGAEEFLTSCQQTIAIVTNKYEKLTQKTVEGLGLTRFPWLRIFGADSLPLRKPDPLPLTEVMRAAGVSRHETLMIGDGIPDMIAARRAGVHSIGVEFGYVKSEILLAQGASLLMKDFSHLPRLIKDAEALAPREISLV